MPLLKISNHKLGAFLMTLLVHRYELAREYKCSKKNMKNMNQLEVNYIHVNMYTHTYSAGTAVCPAGFFFL